MVNSTIVGNSANFGGGIARPAHITLHNNIVAGNTASHSVPDVFSVGITAATASHNLIGTAAGHGITDGVNGNIVGIDLDDVKLGDLANNGGPSQTMALLEDSPAIDAGDNTVCAGELVKNRDQRGYVRPAGDTCDIGAFEFGAVAPPDTTAPVITLTTSSNGAEYLLNQLVYAAYSCKDEADGSGVASCEGTVANGIPINTGSVGTKPFIVNAADNAGNTATTSVSYNVVYGFSGFSAPVNDGVNVAKAGQTIPLKWRLTDAAGNPITNLSNATVRVVNFSCGLTGSEEDLVEEYASGSSGLRHLGDGNYQFNWKTPTSYANSCRTMQLDLGEGIKRTADFRFTR